MHGSGDVGPTFVRRKLLTCKVLAHHLEPLAGPEVEVVVLDAALHVDPPRLRGELQRAVEALDEEGCGILFGYGLCGRATEGVVAARSTLIVPRVDDCIGALLGSRRRHREFMKKYPGCYFLEPAWLREELHVFAQLESSLVRIAPERRQQIAQLTLRHYRTVALLTDGACGEEDRARCREYADRYDLAFREVGTELGLLQRLLRGPWREPEFVVCSPGVPVPLF